MRGVPIVGVLAIAALSSLGACTSSPAEPRNRVVVSAAASLTDAFGEVESGFEEANPGLDVELNLGASSLLRVQILEGAPVDVYASADPDNMEILVETGEVVGAPRIFARNRLQIAVPAGNPAGIRGLEDFAREDILIGLCAEDAPCGGFARQVLRNAGVDAAIDTNETDVRALLTKVEAGELDAAIVYTTDVLASDGTVEGIDIPPAANVTAAYPIAVLAAAPNPGVAERFVEYVLGEGPQVLGRYGFAPP